MPFLVYIFFNILGHGDKKKKNKSNLLGSRLVLISSYTIFHLMMGCHSFGDNLTILSHIIFLCNCFRCNI